MHESWLKTVFYPISFFFSFSIKWQWRMGMIKSISVLTPFVTCSDHQIASLMRNELVKTTLDSKIMPLCWQCELAISSSLDIDQAHGASLSMTQEVDCVAVNRQCQASTGSLKTWELHHYGLKWSVYNQKRHLHWIATHNYEWFSLLFIDYDSPCSCQNSKADLLN